MKILAGDIGGTHTRLALTQLDGADVGCSSQPVGGIAPQLLAVLQEGEFLAGFRAKGRFSDWMERVPVRAILDPDIGLKGAALAATL